MKKITALFLALIFICLSLFSCSGNGGGTLDVTDDGNDTTASEEQVPTIDGSQIAITTDNFSVDLSVVAFFFYEIYNADVSQYGSYMSLMGLDTTKPLKDQTYGDATWFDFYLDSALERIESILLFCEYANENGIELSEADKKEIDTSISQIASQAARENTTTDALISKYYGPIVNEQVFRKCFEITALSSKGYEHYINTLTYTEEEYEEYYSANKSIFDRVDVYKYAIGASIPEDATEDEANAILAAAKAEAESICSAESVEDFKARLGEHIKSLYTGENELSESAVEARVNSCLTEGVTVSELVGLGFAEDADFTVGSYIVKESDADSYQLVYITTEPARNSKLIADMRYILLTSDTYSTEAEAREKAEEIHGEYLAGTPGVESFSALVNEYSDETYNKDVGGLIEGLYEGGLSDAELSAWLFDRSRVQGDTAVVGISAGIMIVYFEAFTGQQWVQEVLYYLQGEDYKVKLEELKGTVVYTEIEDVISQFEA